MASPAVINVRAIAGVLVAVPRLRGKTAQYVARRVDHAAFAAGETDNDLLYPRDDASNASFRRIDDPAVMTEIFNAIRRDRVLLPADQTTAAWTGVPLL